MNDIIISSDGVLRFNNKEYKCSLGKGGVTTNKKEGDGATPAGCFPLRKVYFRPDKFKKSPETFLPTQALSENDGWSDDVNLSEYNTFIKLPYNGSHEKLWRDDYLYDIIVTLGYNDDPPVPGKGSAIFMHIAREGYAPTAGCVGLAKTDLLEILRYITPDTRVCVNE